ncbi:hypothetical protein [Burkholderia gladioli]|uniref:hypothetical protein n=1 Tax=Burkholderia gladioli TaxID=28095 RepID=UPI001C265D01|nr:hypothetical protein [Burkholderia gladioli]MBU9378702.1 hypothetical protein [Burkholderia gladioli]
MPGIRIPTYEQQVQTPLQASGAATPLATVQDNTGAAVQQLGAAASQLGGVLELQKQQDEQANVARQVGNDRVTWLQNLQQMKDSAAPGAPDFTPNVLKGFDDYAQQQLSTMPDGKPRRFYEMQLTDLRNSLATNAITWQAQQHRAYNVDQYTQGSDAAARAIAMDPTQYGQLRASNLALIGTSSLDAETKTKLGEQFKDMAATAAGTRMVSDDPAAALAVMTRSPAGRTDLADLQVNPATIDESQWEKRPDGTTKGNGFLGVLRRPDGGVSTELSVGVELDGKEVDVPSLVPTLTRAEVNAVLSLKDGQPMPDSVVQKAADFARKRIEQGKSPFADPSESPGGAAVPPGYEWVNDLPPAKMLVLQGHARALVAQQQNADASAALQRENGAADIYNQGLKLVQEGQQLSPDFQSQMLQATTGTAVADQTRKLIETASQNAGFASGSLAQQAATLQKYHTEMVANGTDPGTAAVVKQLDQIHTASVEAYKTDPWNAALDRGAIKAVPPVDTSSLPAILQSLTGRAQAVGAVENAAGRRVSLLTPAEAQATLQAVDTLPNDQKAVALGQIGAAMGNAQRIGDLADQWKDKNPVAALAMKAGAASPTGGPLMMQSGLSVAQYILDGKSAQDNKLVKVDAAASTGLQAQIGKQLDGVLPPTQLGDARDTAWYATLAAARAAGHDTPTSSDVTTGVNVATGGLIKTGGKDPRGDAYMAAKPWGWSDDEYSAGVKAVGLGNVENQPGGQPIDAVVANSARIPVDQFMKQFSSYRLQRVGIGGTYTVLTGARPVTDTTGAPLLIHLSRPRGN